MIFDSEMFAWAVAIGAMAQLLTLKQPTKYMQWAAGIEVLGVALVISLFPYWGIEGSTAALLGLGVAKAGLVIGKHLRRAIERIAYWYTGKKEQWDRTPQIQVEESPDPPMTGSEKI